VQVVLAPELMLVGLQDREETRVGATRFTVVLWDEPFKVAVMVAVWFVVNVPIVALKVVEVLLAGTVTEADTGSEVLLLDSPTVLPPLGAA
jgi:hypothetical protein